METERGKNIMNSDYFNFTCCAYCDKKTHWPLVVYFPLCMDCFQTAMSNPLGVMSALEIEQLSPILKGILKGWKEHQFGVCNFLWNFHPRILKWKAVQENKEMKKYLEALCKFEYLKPPNFY